MKIVTLIVFVLIMGVILGYVIGSSYPLVKDAHGSDVCFDLLEKTCKITNSVINTSNMQSDLLEKCYPINLTRLNYLSCDKLT